MALTDFIGDHITEEDTFRYTLPQILKARARSIPDQKAFTFLRDGEDDEDSISYRQLDKAATAIAQNLLDLGKPGDRALMLFPPGLEFIKALFGCFYAGIIAVPAYPPRKNRSLDRLRLLVKDSGASIILSTEDIYNSFERSFTDVTELNALQWNITNKQIPASPPPCPHAPMPSDIALLQYTSGSTGDPKGVMVTHRNIMRNAEYIRQSFRLSQKSVSVTWLPSFHDMGLIDGVLVPVYVGIPGIIIPPVSFLQKPVRWLKAITKYRGTHTGAPNFAFDLCVDGIGDDEKRELDLSSLETLYCGAEPIRKSTFERFIAVYENHGFARGMLYPCYGMAETTLIISGPHPGRGPKYLCISANDLEKHKIIPVPEQHPDARYLTGVGYPWIDTKVQIVDPETRERLDEDQVGEIWVAGSIVTAGYWNRPSENERTFSAEILNEEGVKYLRTGDLGFFHEGELYISGRHKDLIIINGRNIYPQDIEFLAENAHSALRQNASAAFSVDIDGEERLIVVAEVERFAIRELNVEEVCDRIRENIVMETELSVYTVQLLRTASILKTSSGKIQRKACREAFLQNKLDVLGESVLETRFHEEEPDTGKTDLVSLEAWLMTWIHEKLKIPLSRVDVSRPITAYGLTSMKAIALQQDFLEKYGVGFPPYLFFEKVTVKQLCEKALKIIEEN